MKCNKMAILTFLAFFSVLFFSDMGLAKNSEFVIKVANDLSATHPESVCLKDVFKKQIEAKSGGRIKVELYPNSQLGGTREMVEAVQMGNLEMTTPATSVLAGFEKRMQILDLPFLFKSKEAAFGALDGKLGDEISKMLLPQGFVVLGFFENGYRHISNNRKPIKTPADLKGLKIRTMENPMHIAYFKALGANPTPMNFGEVYTALQQKTIDGQENPVAIVYDNKFYEVQKYYSLTGHLFSVTVLLANVDFMNKLPTDLKAIVSEASRNFCLANRKMVTEQEQDTINKIKATGMQVNELSEKQKKPFMDAAMPIYKQFEDIIGKDLMQIAINANNL